MTLNDDNPFLKNVEESYFEENDFEENDFEESYFELYQNN